MIIHYLKLATRSLFANKTFSVINITGLAVGIATCVIIMMVVFHEFSYDHFHAHGERIFRVEKQFTRDGRYSLYANPEFAPTLVETDPRVEDYVRTFDGSRKIVKSDNRHVFFEERFMFADPSFFSIFSFPILEGDWKLLVQPGTAVVTESIAKKYFGTAAVVGEILTFDKTYQLAIVGVAQDPPINSTIQFGIVASFSTLMTMPDERDIVINNSSGFPTYLLLKKKSDLNEVSQSIKKTQYTNPNVVYSLAPLFDNHFNANFESTATTKYAYTFLSVAFLILLLALINYMNLTTARSATRAKEIGIRKVIGARSASLSMQFYFESAVTTVLSFLLAIILIELVQPAILNMIGITLDTTFLHSPYLYASIGMLLLVCVAAAGSYPAMILPRFKVTDVLKGHFAIIGDAGWFRKSLTVFQFSVAICLAICAVVMTRQISYVGSLNTGIDRDQVLVMPVKTLEPGQRRALKNELLGITGVNAVAVASQPLYRDRISGISLVTSPANNEKVGAKWMVADREFMRTLNIASISTLEKPGGAYHLLNESAAALFGITDESTVYSLTMGGDHVPAISGEINGVISDFNYESPKLPIQPLILSIVPDSADYIGDNPTMYVRLSKTSATGEMIKVIHAAYKRFSDASPFSYFFLEDAFNEQQLSEERLGGVFKIFTSIAIMIACLGLFGLITFSSERRRKELSIRKLLGATAVHVLVLLSSEMVVLLTVAAGIAIPVAVYLSQNWLSGFFYRTPISMLDVLWPTFTAFVIAMIVLSLEGMRNAFTNPVIDLNKD